MSGEAMLEKHDLKLPTKYTTRRFGSRKRSDITWGAAKFVVERRPDMPAPEIAAVVASIPAFRDRYAEDPGKAEEDLERVVNKLLAEDGR